MAPRILLLCADPGMLARIHDQRPGGSDGIGIAGTISGLGWECCEFQGGGEQTEANNPL